MSFRAPKGSAAVATAAALVLWAFVVHPWLTRDALGGGPTNTTFTTSTDTSSETIATTETVRVDTDATRLVVIDPLGAVVSDETFPVPFADATVQTAVGAGTTALFAGPPASLFVKGPTLVETTTTLVDTSVQTVETGRMDELTITLEETIGPGCIGVDDRDVPNTTSCGMCFGGPEVPPAGTPFCVLAGTNNVNVNTHTHTVIHALQTTTETYRTTEHYVLRGSFLDHFLLYKVKTSKGTPKLATFGPVTLTDALGAADYDVTKLPAIGLPADTNAEGRADAITHLAQYALKRRKVSGKFGKRSDVAIANQCGVLTLQLAKPESLLVPVAKDLTAIPAPRLTDDHEVDHFLCYKAKAQKKRSDGTPVATLPKGTQVDAEDQFQTRRYDLKKPTRLCVPVATDGTPATKKGVAVPIVAAARQHPAGHLVCYQAKLASKLIAQNGCGPVDPKSKGTTLVPKPAKHTKRRGVGVNGPLGAATLDTAKEVELCIPSTTALP